ncbi:MAG: hypothetical protein V2A56_09620 [bacterium]
MKAPIVFTIALLLTLFFACGEEEKTTGPSNTDPVLSPIGTLSLTAGDLLQVDLVAYDADGDSLSFSIPEDPGFLSITGFTQANDTAYATLLVEPPDSGTFTATVAVSDGQGGTDSEQLTIDVEEEPVSPPVSLSDYFPVSAGASWRYSVSFAEDVQVPYSPWFDYPEFLLSTSFTHGMGPWDAGQIEMTITANDIYQTTLEDTTWDMQLDENAMNFYFYQTFFDSLRYRLTIDDEAATLDLIGVMQMDPPRWRIARHLAVLSNEDLTDQQSITVPAGNYTCVKSDVIVHGDGTYVPSGQYPIETFLAPHIGIVKAIGYDKDDNVLYTLELIEFSSGD